MKSARGESIAPSILSADFACLRDEIAGLAEIPGVDRVHVDIMDGHFVPNLTFGPLMVEAVRRCTDLPIDVHLMIERPSQYFSRFAEAGASGLTFHVEASEDVEGDVERVRELGLRPGITLNPTTPFAVIRDACSWVDLVLVMTVVPGYGGQAFMPEMLAKISAVRDEIRALGRAGAVDIEVDGGIAPKTAPLVCEAGANVLVAGSFLFKHPDGIGAGVTELRRSLGEPI
jgi:ribulose-phosphate 3-epimerase